MFRGSAQLNLDSKGRLVIPARYHEILRERCGGHLVITGDVERNLLVYPLPEWEGIQQKLESLSNLDPRVRALQRRLIGFAVDTEMDAAGRVLVSPELRHYAQLEKAVMLAGMGKKFELWSLEQWESRAAPLAESVEIEGFSL